MVSAEEEAGPGCWQTKARAWPARIARQTGANRTALHSSGPGRRSEPDTGPSSGWRHFPRRRPGRSRLRAEGTCPRHEALDSLFASARWSSRTHWSAQGPGSLLGVSLAPSKGSVVFERAHANHRVAHAAGRSAGRDYVGHSLSPHHGGAALPPASPKHPGNAFQSGSDWSGLVPNAGNHAAGGDGHVPQRMGAPGGRTGDLATGLERWFATVERPSCCAMSGKKMCASFWTFLMLPCRKIGPGSVWEC